MESRPTFERTASTEGVLMRHPAPGLEAIQGAYIANIDRLEETAERLSTGTSSLGEEIRKLQQEQKLGESRRGSLHSTTLIEEGKARPNNRSRNTSTSSYANSIIDLNNSARWGGYSPGAFVGSPVGSVRSGSWSQRSAPLNRPRSISRGSKLEQISDTEVSQSTHQSTRNDSPPKIDNREDTHIESFSATYDLIANEIQRQLDFPGHIATFEESRDKVQSQGGIPERSATAASGEIYQDARSLFHDFDGVHCSPDDEHGIDFMSNMDPADRDSAMLRSLPQPLAYVPPGPSDNMVYYPAPVPRVLNLPKRLSQLPAASVQAKRRTQLLDAFPSEARKSAAWLPDERRSMSSGPSEQDSGTHKRNGSVDPSRTLHMSNLPPQLRASVFFDQPAAAQEVEIMGDSAAATLDNILEAAVHAPAHAFTDHPFAGPVGSGVYGRESMRASTASLTNSGKHAHKKSKGSINLFRAGRSSSSADLGGSLQRRSSKFSLPLSLDGKKSRDSGEYRPAPSAEAAEEDDLASEKTPLHRSDSEADDEEQGHETQNENQIPEELEEPQFFGQPTTLLAELQMRKQQQKLRNRTAATAFPNGMHSTLLEMDAVAQVQKNQRKNNRVALAWEDPVQRAADTQNDEDDDDVPLGMLFAGRVGGAGAVNAREVDRPIGLIERRELEDNEPLSRRRNRLFGNPINRQPSPAKHSPLSPPPDQSTNPLPSPELKQQEESEDEEETLAQRLRRLKTREQLDGAIKDVQTRPVSGDFATEMMGRLGVSNQSQSQISTPPLVSRTPPNEEEETLGQRRIRLRAEASGGGGTPGLLTPGGRPPLNVSRSMADLLAANPVGNAARKVSEEMLVANLTPGSLLQRNEKAQARIKAQTSEEKGRIGFGKKPLVDVPQGKDLFAGQQQAGFLNAGLPPLGFAQNMGMGTPSPGMLNPMALMSSPNLAGIGVGVPGVSPMPGMNGMGAGSYFPQMQPQQFPMMGVGMGMNMQMNMQVMQQQMAAMGYPQGMGIGIGMSGGMGMGVGGDPMEQRQRDMIDRWRQSVMR
ncbi:hypothetical protein M501DRAFT_1013304 [Patellaria atrata CBS 101060]|uniref:Uncharacterized protein n=1 Tax=Patellaria atrata CBS 101060 TaxID=1346257 RepID=A0A9P4SFH4_9PEZI|nr:hypothetical protein M501DRAFT_1013304 [Patellaria atrata CBS 101060]